MSTAVLVPAMIWVTLLLVAGGLALVRARDVHQRVIALDLLAIVVVALWHCSTSSAPCCCCSARS